MLGIRPGRKIGPALADQFERQVRAKPVNRSDVSAEQTVQGIAKSKAGSFDCFLVAHAGDSLPTGVDDAFRSRFKTTSMRASQIATLGW